MDHRGAYTHSLLLDYPSVSQINHKVKENSINIIFAVTKEKQSAYDRLSKVVEGASSGTLSNDSSNVVELIKDQYNVSYFCTSQFMLILIYRLTWDQLISNSVLQHRMSIVLKRNRMP